MSGVWSGVWSEVGSGGLMLGEWVGKGGVLHSGVE